MNAGTNSDNHDRGHGGHGSDRAVDADGSDRGDGSDHVVGEVLLDVRPIIERGEEPFGTIMQTVAGLDGRALVLVAPFEPTPLEGVLSAQGFTYEAEQVGDNEWRVRFEPAQPAVDDDVAGGAVAGGADGVAEQAVAGGTGAAAGEAPVPDAVEERASVSAGGDAPVEESPYTIRARTSSMATASDRPPGTQPPSVAGSSAPKPPASVMAMDPTTNVPPAWLPLGFMAAAGLGLIGFGLAVMVTAPTAVVSARSDHVIAAVHLGVLAFLSTAVLGALHQFGPVVGARPLRSVAAGVLAWVLFVPGAWTIALGFATGHNPVVQIGGVLVTTAVCIVAWNVSQPLSATGKGAPIVGLRLAVLYLVVTAAFGVTYAFDRGHLWFALLADRVLAHAHLGLLGWLGLAYVAVAEKLWPMFLLAHRPHARDGERAVWLIGAGAPVVTIGLLWSLQAVTVAGGALVVAGLGFHLSSLASVIRHRRRNLELLHGFVLVSAAFLVVAVVIAVVAGLAPMGTEWRSRLVAAEVFSLILWLALAVIGHAHKIVPFISWNRLRDRGIMTGRDGRALLFAHLVNQEAARVTFALALLGAVTGMLGALSATSWLVRIAGISLALTGAVAIANLASGPLSMIRWHDRHQRHEQLGDGELVHGEQSHGEQSHGEQSHGEQQHGQPPRDHQDLGS